MNDQTVITVYRNSAERQFWESGIAGPFFIGILVFFITVVLTMKILESLKLPRFSKKRKYAEYTSMVISLAAGLGTCLYLLS